MKGGGKRRQHAVVAIEVLEEKIALSSMVATPTYVVSHPLSGRASPAASGSNPGGLSPVQVRNAYGISGITFHGNGATVAGDGTGQTIAIVDAYDDPSIAADLTTFDAQFGLAAPASFTKVGVNSSGNASTTRFPAADAGWAGEIELDVEWAHAIAPKAAILLVEAASSNLNDLLAGVNYARSAPGVVAVSMSWGGNDFAGETSYDSYFTTPAGHAGVTFFASSGDNGSPSGFPAVSSHVVAVGGTTLYTDSAGNYLGEGGWTGSGGGLSTYVGQPGYQSGLVIHNGGQVLSSGGARGVPDVAFNADPNSGVAVYGSFGWGGWAVVGGTSEGAPQWAGLMAIVDQGLADSSQASLDGYTQTLPRLYQLPASDFHDITSGSNGYSAGTGYDLVTGRGSPIASLLVAGLTGASGTSGSSGTGGTGGTGGTSGTGAGPTITTAPHITSQSATTVGLSVAASDTAGSASLTYTWTVSSASGAGVTANRNSSNAAQNITATFTAVGTYTFQVTVSDPSGLTATSSVTVTVSPVVSSLTVTPGAVTLAPGGTQQFTVSGRDQFGNTVANPAVTWSVASGSGTVNASGSYKAGAATGSSTVAATSGTVRGQASVTLSNASTPPSGSVLFSDNFESGASKWTADSGSYFLARLSNGNHRLLVENLYGEVSRAVAGSASWTNTSVQGTITLLNNYGGTVTLLARVQDDSHLYFFGYSEGLGAWAIWRENGPGTTTLLARGAAFTMQPNVDYVVRADLNGSSLALSVNGVLQVTATDSTFTSGKIGFSATMAVATLDNVTVTALSSAAKAASQRQASGASLAGSAGGTAAGAGRNTQASGQGTLALPWFLLNARPDGLATNAAPGTVAGSAPSWQAAVNGLFGTLTDPFWENLGWF
jgi:hypothetical protein